MLPKDYVREDILTAALFILIGLTAVIGSLGLSIGSIDNFGPGMFPLLLGGLLCLIGMGLAASATTQRIPDASTPEKGSNGSPRGLIFIPLACITFGLIVSIAGLFIASAIAVYISTFSDKNYSRKTALILSICVALLVCSIFVFGIGIQIPVFPMFLYGV